MWEETKLSNGKIIYNDNSWEYWEEVIRDKCGYIAYKSFKDFEDSIEEDALYKEACITELVEDVRKAKGFIEEVTTRPNTDVDPNLDAALDCLNW